jgi:hypothetical protein
MLARHLHQYVFADPPGFTVHGVTPVALPVPQEVMSAGCRSARDFPGSGVSRRATEQRLQP